MPPLDPSQLLKALNPLLGPTGALLGSTEATRIASLMKDASKMVSKCVYLNILKLETPKEAIEKFLSIGGWDILNEWLQEFKEGENDPLLSEILKVYKTLPVTVEILKKNNAAKTIKQLCKSENENVKTLANNIFGEWMKKVKNNNNNTAGSSSTTDSKVKKKKKDKERKDDDEKGENSKNNDKSDAKSDKGENSRNNDKSDTKSEKSESKTDSKSDIKSDKSKTKDSKSSHHSSHPRHHSGDRRTSSTHISSHDRKTDSVDPSSNHSPVSDEVVSVRKGSGLKLHIKLGTDKEKSDKSDPERKRPSTVKIPPSKFRSTGLEEENLPGKSMKVSSLEKQQPPKRTSTDNKLEPPVKKSRLHMPPPLSVPSPVALATSMATTPTSTSPTSPGEMHGKIKLIPARPKPNHSIHDSSGFMDSLLPAPRTYGAFKKKKKAMAAAANGTPPSTPTGKVPTTPPSPLSPTTAVARSLPAVPSFYKDTQAESELSPEQETKERSPSPVEADLPEPAVKDETKDDTTPVQMEIDNDDDTGDYDPEDKERSLSPDSLSGISKETKGLLTTGSTLKKKKKKRVQWKEEHELKEIFYFELDEDERVNVNRAKDFDQAKKNEMINDRRVIETSRRLVNDNMMEQLTWYRPKLMAGVKEIDYGKESTEKNIQKVREQGVLQALYFNRNMLPDGPQEPDVMHEEVVETKTIPLEDVSGGDEFLYNYDQHPEAVKNAPPVEPHWQQQQQPPGPPPMGPPMGPPMPQQPPLPPPPMMPNLPQGLNLPPELMGLIAQIQNMPPDQSGPVMAQVQQMLNNIMCGSSDQSFELQQLHQLMSSQMGMPPEGMIPGPPPMMGPPMGMPPNGHPMGPRTGLLGNAPPGFMPQRPMGPGPPPNRFGGPGPGQQVNWNEQPPNWNEEQQQHGNWNDGPPMGPGGPGRQNNNNWGSRRRGSGGSRGRGRGGTSRHLCRHFASGSCKLGSECGFLHPGINGPPLKKNEQVVDS